MARAPGASHSGESRGSANTGVGSRAGMKLCGDENIKRSILTLLQQEGFDVVRVQDALELGYDDEAIVTFCREEDHVIVTNYTDFFFEFDSHPEIFFLNSQGAPHRDVITAV